MSETQKRAYIIADNRLALSAGWDEETLSLELVELKEADFDLSLTGFDVKELDDLLTSGDDDQANEVPPLPLHPVSRTGDLWLCVTPAFNIECCAEPRRMLQMSHASCATAIPS